MNTLENKIKRDVSFQIQLKSHILLSLSKPNDLLQYHEIVSLKENVFKRLMIWWKTDKIAQNVLGDAYSMHCEITLRNR